MPTFHFVSLLGFGFTVRSVAQEQEEELNQGLTQTLTPLQKEGGGLEEVKTVVGCLCLQRQTERRRDKREVQGKD